MEPIAPWARTGGERSTLCQSALEMVGRRVEVVRYLIPATSDVLWIRYGPDFDSQAMGVEMVTPDGLVFLAAWRMEGMLQGLSFGIHDSSTYVRSSRLRAIDVSETGPWVRRRHRRIQRMGLAWHVPDEGCPDTVWSVRMEFGDSLSAVIALGEALGPEPITYMPDELVVIFEPSLAKGYVIPAGYQSSWGDDVEG